MELSKSFLDTRLQTLVLRESKGQRVDPRLLLLHLDLEALAAISKHRVADLQLLELNTVRTLPLSELLNRSCVHPHSRLLMLRESVDG